MSKLLPQGRGLSAVLQRRAATVELDWDVRQKSRFDVVDTAGRMLGVFLARGSVVRGGDVLVAEDGSLIKVLARPQPVMVVRICREHGSPFDLLRAAYHLGNRHVPLQLEPDHIKFEPDHVLGEMLRRMHLIVTEADEAFEPEAGAYAAGGKAHGHEPAPLHSHDQSHHHDHDHAHAHAHAHARDDAHADDRVHDPARAAQADDQDHTPDHAHDHLESQAEEREESRDHDPEPSHGHARRPIGDAGN